MSHYHAGRTRAVDLNIAKAVRVLGLSVAALLLCLPLFSQSNTGRISGAVTDQTGGAIAGAMVTVTDVARGITRNLTTDDSGEYNAPNLIPGAFTIRAEAAGFQAVERQNIDLLVGQEARVDFTLQPGAQNQTITVTEQIPLVNTTSAAVTATIDNQDITQLPLNGRNFQSMTDFRPGVQTKPGGGTDARFTNGQQSEENIWLLDGLFNKGTYGGNSVIGGGNLAGEGATLVPLDTIQDVTFIENPKAEYGWGTGAIVNLGFKSGTNTLHGSAYAYGHSDALDAKNPFATQKAGTELVQPGMSLGGPIKKNKIFFFGGYEGKRVSSSTTAVSTEPTTATLGGGATGIANSFPDAIAALEKTNGYCNPAAAGCTKPLSQLSLNLAGCTLAPGLTGAATCNASQGLFNYSGTVAGSHPVQIPNLQHTDNMLAKIDYHISDKNSLNGEYFLGTGNTYSNTGTPVQPYWGSTTPVRGQGFTVVDVWTPSSSWVNEARGGYHRYNQIIGIGECANNGAPPQTAKSAIVGYTDGSPDYPTTFGLNTGTPVPCGMPFLTVGTFTALGDESRGYEPRLENAYKGEDAVSYTRGPHVFKVGVEYRYSRLVGGAHGFAQGAINFGTAGINAFNGATPLESFLVGSPSSGQLLVGSPDTTTVQSFYAAFVQDDWRATRKLTLNLGLRWEYTSPLGEASNHFGDFVNNQAISPSGVVQIGSTPGYDSLWQGDYREFMPRVGLAWDITGKGKTVLRAGSGIMFAYNATSGMIGNNNIDPNSTPTGVPFYAPNGTTVPGPPGGNINTAILSIANTALSWTANQPVFNVNALGLACGEGSAPGVVPPPGMAVSPQQCGVGGFDPHMRTPPVYYWNLDIQHTLGNNLSFDIGYVGNHSSGLIQETNLNQPTPGLPNKSPFAAGLLNGSSFIEQVREPFYSTYPWINQIRWESNRDNANYDALQVTVNKRLSHGVSFTATYVYSHSLDVVDGEFGALATETSANPRLDYGNAAYNPFHRFTVTGTWAIPGVKAPAQMLQGWRVNAVVFMLSRIPYNTDDTTDDVSGTGALLDRWTLVGNPQDFRFGSTPRPGGFPCYGVTGSTFGGKGCNTTLPAQCLSAAQNEPTNSSVPSLLSAAVTGAPLEPVNSGLYNLYKYGCYMQGSTVIVPPAQGTYGNMARDELFGPGEREFDMSVTKDWKLKERLTAQFRFEVFNVFNKTQYAVPSANLANPTTFGTSQATINLGGIAIAPGAPRQVQLGLRLMF